MKKIILLPITILAFGFFVFTFFINNASASCLYDPNNPQPCNDTPGFLPNNYCSYTNINSNLYYGGPNNREEVRTLQNFLFNYFGVSGEINASGFFGKLTRNYVAQFQRQNALYPVTGGVGPLTRDKMKALCGNVVDNSGGGPNCKVWFDGCNTCSRSYVGGPQMCTLMACVMGGDANYFRAATPYCKEYFTGNSNEAPVIKSFTGPVKLNVDEKGTWKIDASIFNNQPLSYNITWGDENYFDRAYSAPFASMNSVVTQSNTFEHSYNVPGTFTVSITVTAQNGQTAKTTSTVVVQNNTTTLNPETNGQCRKWTDSYGSECRRDYKNGPVAFCRSWTAEYFRNPNLTPVCTEFFPTY